jgi:hypothetical protein
MTGVFRGPSPWRKANPNRATSEAPGGRLVCLALIESDHTRRIGTFELRPAEARGVASGALYTRTRGVFFLGTSRRCRSPSLLTGFGPLKPEPT